MIDVALFNLFHLCKVGRIGKGRIEFAVAGHEIQGFYDGPVLRYTVGYFSEVAAMGVVDHPVRDIVKT